MSFDEPRQGKHRHWVLMILTIFTISEFLQHVFCISSTHLNEELTTDDDLFVQLSHAGLGRC